MSFYRQSVVRVDPVEVVSGTGTATTLSWDEEDGATRTPVPFLVDLQPVESSAQPGESLHTSGELDKWTLHTPPGRVFEVTKRSAFEYGDLLLHVRNVRVWPSGDYTTGVDHYEVELEDRYGTQ